MTARLILATLLGVLVGYGVSEFEPQDLRWGYWTPATEPAASSPAPHAHTAAKE